MQTRVGHELGNYRLMKLLGRGGYAEVYLAENKYLGVQTAIKVLKLRDLDPLEQEKFRSEAKFMTTLDHPHIIKVLDYGIEMSQRGSGVDGSTPYLVMEYAPLGTLRHLYSQHDVMPLPKVAFYTKQIAEALQYAHDKNIIHLDVKPQNMLVRKPDDVALSDFGIAVSGVNTSNLGEQQNDILQKMARGEQIAISGTAQYLAPERLQGYTQRTSDQYSLAVVVYEWLCGRLPFEGSDLEICRKHAHEEPPPPSSINPAITRKIEQVVLKALAKQPSDRYRSVWEFSLDLEAAIKMLPLPTIPLPTIPVTPDSSYHFNAPKQQNSTTENESLQEQQQHVPWWRQESQPLILADSLEERLDSPSTQQGKEGVTQAFRKLLHGATKQFLKPKQQTGVSPMLSASPLPKAPSTVLFSNLVLPDEELKDFFINHCRADDAWANWIAWELEEAGYSVILPSWDFHAGSDLERQIQKAAIKARSSIVVLSSNYFNVRTAQYVRNILLGLDKVNEKHVLLPILVRESGSDLEMLLERIKCIDIVGLGEVEARIKLLAEVRGERFKPTRRPIFPGNTFDEKSPLPDKQPLVTRVLSDEVSPLSTKNVEIFFSYSHQDEILRKELEMHLSPLRRRYSLNNWHDRCIDAGVEFAKEIDKHLQTANIILLLVTPDFLASNYCYDIEMTQALERHDGEKVVVVPLILRPASWKRTPFGHLQTLPRDGISVSSSLNRDAAFVEIAEGIEKTINKVIKNI